MPHTDPDKRKEANRQAAAAYRKKMKDDSAFQKKEAERKAAWFQKHKARRRKVQADYRKRLKKGIE